MLGQSPVSSRTRVAFSTPRLSRAEPTRPRGLCLAARAFSPPTVAETKQGFLDAYNKPVSAMYNTVVQELLVQQHFMRYNIKYKYDQVFALGITSVFSQILDDMSKDESEAIFSAYIKALGEDAKTYQQDADKITKLAESCSGPDDLKPDGDGSEIQKILSGVAARNASGEFFYTRFFAIGLFRMLELTEAHDPKALKGLVTSLGLKQEQINKDLLLYKSILSKMSAAKELMAEFLEREKRKQSERDTEKAEKAAGGSEATETKKEEVKAEAKAEAST